MNINSQSNINRPSKNEVSKYLARWNSNDEYVQSDESLSKMFTQTYPFNDNIHDVLIKVCSLNAIYSTNILSNSLRFTVAKHIVDLHIDQRLADKDKKLVNQIAKVKVNGHKTINFYSFATKYCSHHFPEYYSMYDGYVEQMLMHFMRVDKFYNSEKVDLRCYRIYHHVITTFKERYKLQQYTLKEIDIYLWQAGKEHFLKQYSRGKSK